MIVWQTSPQVIIDGLEKYRRDALAAIQALADLWAQDTVRQMRVNAPWQNRSHDARNGLMYAIDGLGLGSVTPSVDSGPAAKMTDTAIEAGSDDVLVVCIGHSVFYGKYLELSRGGMYAVVMSTIQGNLPALERDLARLMQ